MRRPAAASPLSPDRKNRLNCLGHSPGPWSGLPKFAILAKGQKTFVAIDGGCCDGIRTLQTSKNSASPESRRKKEDFRETVRREQLSSKRRAGWSGAPPLVRAVGRRAPPRARPIGQSLGMLARSPNLPTNRIPGATLSSTVKLRLTAVRPAGGEIDALRETVRAVRRQSPFHIDAWAVLPDHMHCLWTLPEGDSDFPDRVPRNETASRNRCPIADGVS